MKTTHELARELLALPDTPVLVMRGDGDCFDPVLYIDDTDGTAFVGYHHWTLTHRALAHEHLRLAHPGCAGGQP